MTFRQVLVLPLFVVSAAVPPGAPASGTPPDTVWLRVVNAAKGPIQVRLGESGPWATLGHVFRPATRTAPGFGAARWAKSGTVAATAVHGIRLKIGVCEFGAMISFVPREFASIPDLYGGHVPGDSGIRTDIPSGTSLFREWAPVAGSPVFLELASGAMPIPAGYVPASGDVLLVSSRWAVDAPESVVFENRKGGAVTARDWDGTSLRIGLVTQPVRGVGRFDGTSFTGIGSVNTNHPGVITIATAPVSKAEAGEGTPPERRGGFMISPSVHVKDQANGSPQVMGVAPLTGEPAWEGRFPLFSQGISLLSGESGFRAEIQVDSGQWEPVPMIIGRDDNALTAKRLARYLTPDGRVVQNGVTAIRLLYPRWNASAMRGIYDIALAAQSAKGKEPTGVYSLLKGTLTYVPKGAFRSVSCIVDGDTRAVGNTSGFRWTWDTRQEGNGRHWLQIRREALDGSVKTETRRVLVLNGE